METFPLFIVVEGLDGCGKSTLVDMLSQDLDALSLATPLRSLREVREQIDREFGDRGLARTLWYLANVVQASERVGLTLNSGRSVVLDRYWMTTLAYAECQMESCDLNPIVTHLVRNLREPDLTVMLTCPSDVRLQRLKQREQIKSHDLQFMDPAEESRLVSAYRRLSECIPARHFLELQCHLETPESLSQRILAHIQC